ncbi:MAG: DNA repair protein RecO [Alphaproteobacteria bacterium]|nr:DNA repair protein RecO [Alphaproteobacteria bacterium]
MEWQDDAIVLSARRWRENGMLLTVLSAQHGLARGLLHGGQSKKKSPHLQAGNVVHVQWRARLAEQLGHFTLEVLKNISARWLSAPAPLACVGSACHLLEICCAEGHPMPQLFDETIKLFETDHADDWPARYVMWEISLLSELGYGLDLSRCALTGIAENLAFVSPKTGRAVCLDAGKAWEGKLLPLPAFLTSPNAPAEKRDIQQGLALAAHFIERHLLAGKRHTKLPELRKLIVG